MHDGVVVNLRDFPGKGYRRTLPPDVVRVDRGTPWGNPFRVGDPHPDGGYPIDRWDAIALYQRYLEDRVTREPAWLEPLRGKRLACWCYPRPCHASYIVEWHIAHPRVNAGS